jgi:hypothetical protein
MSRIAILELHLANRLVGNPSWLWILAWMVGSFDVRVVLGNTDDRASQVAEMHERG